ncbi:MAG: hypothetical protein ACLQHA_08665, partial [Thermoplasmata archaeon]
MAATPCVKWGHPNAFGEALCATCGAMLSSSAPVALPEVRSPSSPSPPARRVAGHRIPRRTLGVIAVVVIVVVAGLSVYWY